MGQVLTAYVGGPKAYDFALAKFPRAKILSFGMTSVLVFFLTLSGAIDFLAGRQHERQGTVRDIGANPEAKWIAENTPRDAVILTSQPLYQRSCIAGRKIFLGYAYFTDSAGYDTRGRRKIVDAIYRGDNRDSMCRLLHLNNISYVEVDEFKPNPRRPAVNVEYFRANFVPEYVSENGRYEVYSTREMCE